MLKRKKKHIIKVYKPKDLYQIRFNSKIVKWAEEIIINELGEDHIPKFIKDRTTNEKTISMNIVNTALNIIKKKKQIKEHSKLISSLVKKEIGKCPSGEKFNSPEIDSDFMGYVSLANYLRDR